MLRSKCEYYFITFTITTLLTALVKRRAVTACDGRRVARRERRLFHPRAISCSSFLASFVVVLVVAKRGSVDPAGFHADVDEDAELTDVFDSAG